MPGVNTQNKTVGVQWFTNIWFPLQPFPRMRELILVPERALTLVLEHYRVSERPHTLMQELSLTSGRPLALVRQQSQTSERPLTLVKQLNQHPERAPTGFVILVRFAERKSI